MVNIQRTGDCQTAFACVVGSTGAGPMDLPVTGKVLTFELCDCYGGF
jgi:hypothetical protein